MTKYYYTDDHAECSCGKRFTIEEYRALKHGCDWCYRRNHLGDQDAK